MNEKMTYADRIRSLGAKDKIEPTSWQLRDARRRQRKAELAAQRREEKKFRALRWKRNFWGWPSTTGLEAAAARQSEVQK